jgi:tetratricopeptide (TPR) repeat protein
VADPNEQPARPAPTIRQVWQLPVLLLSVGLFAAGLYLIKPEHQTIDHLGPALQEALEAIGKGEHESALVKLNEAIIHLETADAQRKALFHALVGDALSLGQRSKGWSQPINHRNVIEAYEKAEAMGLEGGLSEARRTRLADSYAESGQLDKALALLSSAGETGAAARQALLRRLAQGAVDRREMKTASDRLAELLKEPNLTRANEVWAVARQAELLGLQDKHDQAIDLLLRRVARLQGDKEAPLAEIMVQLARAYQALSQPAQAERWLVEARAKLDASDELNAEVLLRLGQIRFAEEKTAEALELFTQVTERFVSSPSYLPALIGKGECEARQGAAEASLAAFERSVELLTIRPQPNDELSRHVIAALNTQHDLLTTQGDWGKAMKYLALQQPLHAGKPPASFLLNMATLHEQIARQMLGLKEGENDQPEHWSKLDAPVRTRVAEHFASAAELFLQHADSVRKTDDPAYGQSLWRGADLYDRSGLHDQAVKAFSEFILQRESDPRRISAMARVAQAYQAQGNLAEAIRFYQRLVDDHGNTPEGYASLVPLARALLAKDLKQADEAERVLLTVVTDHPAIRPESTEYREALVELGQLYYRRGGEGDYEKAIARLSEVVGRYGGRESMPELEFNLGDAYRKSVEQIDAKLAGTLPPSTRTMLTQERSRRLDQARRHMDAVITAYEKSPSGSLNPMQQLYLRNSYFYRADCAFELGQLEGPNGAIVLYEAAIQRYESEPAALVGLVQIVNSYGQMKRWDEARKANERAKIYLRRIPEEAFNDPTLPMSREHWQRWLEWTSQLASTPGTDPSPAP